MSAYMYRHVCKHVCARMCGCQTSISSVVLQDPYTFLSETGPILGLWGSLVRLDRGLGSPQAVCCLCFLSTVRCVPSFYVGSGDQTQVLVLHRQQFTDWARSLAPNKVILNKSLTSESSHTVNDWLCFAVYKVSLQRQMGMGLRGLQYNNQTDSMGSLGIIL